MMASLQVAELQDSLQGPGIHLVQGILLPLGIHCLVVLQGMHRLPWAGTLQEQLDRDTDQQVDKQILVLWAEQKHKAYIGC